MARQVGWNKSVVVGSATIRITASSWDEMVDALDVTDSGDGGVQALLSGILRGDGHIEGFIDAAAMPTGYGIYAGNSGLIYFGWGSALPHTVPCMIVKVTHKSAVAGTVQYGFDVKLNSLAGTYVRAN